ncbi:hypothetical protein LCGC14_0980830 [marine sediment metagenome]|uniref:Uncharacterized protein n=1 Tax=marine sediment metagenome TaxID=412755 RepID=A0A0F9N8S1_9ZZZZ
MGRAKYSAEQEQFLKDCLDNTENFSETGRLKTSRLRDLFVEKYSDHPVSQIAFGLKIREVRKREGMYPRSGFINKKEAPTSVVNRGPSLSMIESDLLKVVLMVKRLREGII